MTSQITRYHELALNGKPFILTYIDCCTRAGPVNTYSNLAVCRATKSGKQAGCLYVCLHFFAAGLPDWVARHTAKFEYLFTGPALVQQSMYVSINVYPLGSVCALCMGILDGHTAEKRSPNKRGEISGILKKSFHQKSEFRNDRIYYKIVCLFGDLKGAST